MSKSPSTLPINRRQFLRLSSLSVGLLAVAPYASALEHFSAPVSLNSGAKKYRAEHGRIFISTDAGQTWQEVVKFGSAIHIEALTADENGKVTAHLRDKQHRFQVQSSNDRTWLTANYRAHSIG